jgi:hypothetical protein
MEETVQEEAKGVRQGQHVGVTDEPPRGSEVAV